MKKCTRKICVIHLIYIYAYKSKHHSKVKRNKICFKKAKKPKGIFVLFYSLLIHSYHVSTKLMLKCLQIYSMQGCTPKVYDTTTSSTMEEYVANRKDTVSMYVINSTEIFNECMKTKPSSRYNNQLVCWGYLKNEIVLLIVKCERNFRTKLKAANP